MGWLPMVDPLTQQVADQLKSLGWPSTEGVVRYEVRDALTTPAVVKMRAIAAAAIRWQKGDDLVSTAVALSSALNTLSPSERAAILGTAE